MTVAIVFAGGTYGTYLEWCLTTLTSESSICSPFVNTGSSHKFLGNNLLNINGWDAYCRSSEQLNFVRLHPKTKKEDSLTKNLEKVCSQASKVIHLYPTETTNLLCINNAFFKIWKNWWGKNFETYIDPNLIYKNWPVAPGTDINDVPVWVKREFLSFYLMPCWYDQIELNCRSVWRYPNYLKVTVDSLLFRFETTLEKIQKFCNLDFKRPISDLSKYHQLNLQSQHHLNHDSLCNNIVDAVIKSKDLNWDDLTLCSESWIQWQLRNKGWELKCNGLDTFPTNSLQLKELLYHI